MKAVETRISKFVGSGAMALLLVVAAAAMLISGAALMLGPGSEADALISTPPSMTASSQGAAIGLATLGIVASIGIMALINKGFSVMRSNSKLYVGLFALMTCATAAAAGSLMTGMALCVTVLWLLMIMYTIYQRRGSSRRVFFVFAALTAGSFIFYGFGYFLPVMLIGCAQMRCMSLRSLMAAVIGVVTPVWILLGFSIIDFGDFCPPTILPPTPAVIAAYTPTQFIAIAALCIAGFFTTILNTIKAYGLNAKTRAFNGILATMSIWTILISIVDLGHALIYAPLLSAFTAMQLTLYYQLNMRRRAYLAVVAIVGLFVALFLCQAFDLI